MKKIATLCALIFFGLSSFGQSSLPNGNFESWYFAAHPTHAQQGFYEPSGPFFHTLNILDTIATPPGLTCYRTDSVHAGNYAARVITQQIALMEVIIPGVVGTINIDWAGMRAILGESYTWATKPSRFQGSYMSFPVNNDSSAAIVLLSKWNIDSYKRDTIAYTRLVFHGTVNNYTFFDEPITYLNNVTMPDSITVLLLSCAGYNAKYMLGSVGSVGSQAYFDDVTLTDIAGFEYQLMPEVSVKLSPNPTSGILRVDLGEEIRNGVFEVINLQGKVLKKYVLDGLFNTINLGDLANGSYYYKISRENQVVNSGSFVFTH